MIINYINTQGNFTMLETFVDTEWDQKVENIGNTWFEKRNVVPVVEKKEVKKEEIVVGEFDEVAAKEFLKEKGIRGYGLLKGEGLKNRAIQEGFIIQ